ncbi:MAG: NTP transferase domain-containing protein [Candidatus Glassbacteria bacterium]|nr:NTP transferase domain-containing protein [Candidatus Glassbacteria bacterium]
MDKVIAILQARMHSERLPGKILADLAGKPLILHVIERLQGTPGVDRVVMAVPRTETAYLAPLAERAGAEIIGGAFNDVLGRFYQAAKRYPAPYVIRATGDNPLLDTTMLERCIQECQTGCWDMVGASNLPLGTGAEVFPASLLDYLHHFGRKSHHREHVTSLLYEHEDEFRVCRLDTPPELRAPEFRLTVDADEDLELMRRIYDRLYVPGKLVDLADAVRMLRDEPGLAEINRHVRQRDWRKDSIAASVA